MWKILQIYDNIITMLCMNIAKYDFAVKQLFTGHLKIHIMGEWVLNIWFGLKYKKIFSTPLCIIIL